MMDVGNNGLSRVTRAESSISTTKPHHHHHQYSHGACKRSSGYINMCDNACQITDTAVPMKHGMAWHGCEWK